MARIKINGSEYEFPTLDSVTLDEAVLLERYAGISLASLEPGSELPLGAVKGLIVVAIKRAQPQTSEREISEVIGQLKLSELSGFFEAEDDAGPPDRALGASSGSTGSSTNAGSDVGVHYPEPSRRPATGTPALDISSDSDHAISAGSPPNSLTVAQT